MKHLTRLLLLTTASCLWAGAASADIIVTSHGDNGTIASGFVTYSSGPVSYSGSSSTNNGAFTGPAGTYNIGDGGVWQPRSAVPAGCPLTRTRSQAAATRRATRIQTCRKPPARPPCTSTLLATSA